MRSGIGPERDLQVLGIPVVADLPAGSRLLDHCGTTVAWRLSGELQAEAREHAAGEGLVEPHVVLKAASSRCPPDTWDLHLLSWISPSEGGPHEAAAIVFHMKPLSTGRVRLRSRDPLEAPVVERGFLTREEDLAPILEGIELARRLAGTPPLRELLEDEVRPGLEDPERYSAVVDGDCRVFGVEGLLVADASVMPTIPRANTNLTTAAIAERVAAGLA
jgi:choline dehydrogenase